MKDVGVSAFDRRKLKKTHLGNAGTVVVFYGDWCEHCKVMAPHLKEFARSMGSMFKVVAVESKNKELIQRFGISGFPTFKYVRSDGVLVPADNFGRDKQSMFDFACSKASVCKQLK